MGGQLAIRGHGVRERQLRGPLELGAQPEFFPVKVRRYRCLSCKAILLVVPRGVLPRRLYPAFVIAWVFARIGLENATTKTVRQEVCPSRFVGKRAADRWLAPFRWVEARRKGLLFAKLGRVRADSPRKQVAARTAMQLVALGNGSGAASPRLAWHGAALAA